MVVESFVKFTKNQMCQCPKKHNCSFLKYIVGKFACAIYNHEVIFHLHLIFLFLRQGNEASAWEAGLCFLPRLSSDGGSGGQLVPAQTLALEEWPRADECEYLTDNEMYWGGFSNINDLTVLSAFNVLFFVQVLVQHAEKTGDERLLKFHSLLVSS